VDEGDIKADSGEMSSPRCRVKGMIKLDGKIEWLESGKGLDNVMEFRLNLGRAIYHFGNRQNALEDLDNPILLGLGLGFGIRGAAKAVVSIAVKLLAALAHITHTCDVLDDAETELALETDNKVVIFHSILFIESWHCHEGHRCPFVKN
jgi:hypothetical protein